MIGRPLPVFRLDFSVWALRRRPRNAIDRWDGVTYRRLIVLEGRPSELAVHLEIITYLHRSRYSAKDHRARRHGQHPQRERAIPGHPQLRPVLRFCRNSGPRVLKEPAELGPLATVEFVIQRVDTAGGPGANFLVQWVGQSDVDELLIEAVMIGQSGNAGISFTSTGRVIKNEPRQ